MAAAAVLLLMLTACSGEEQQEERLDLGGDSDSASVEPEPPEESSAAPAGVPEPSAPPDEGDRVRQQDSSAYALTLPSEDPAQLVGQTLVDYMSARLAAYNTGTVDLPALSRVSFQEPLTTVQTRVLELRQEQQRTVGDVWFDIGDDDVDVTGQTAEFSGVCMLNASVDVDRRNVAVESPPPGYRASGTARRVARDVWLIDTLAFDPAPGC